MLSGVRGRAGVRGIDFGGGVVGGGVAEVDCKLPLNEHVCVYSRLGLFE